MTKEELSDLRETWKERIAAFHASGQSGAAWCATHQLKEHQLWYWVRRFRSTSNEQSSPQGFVSVQVREPGHLNSAPLLVRVGSAAIEVHPGYDEQLLCDLVQTLTSKC